MVAEQLRREMEQMFDGHDCHAVEMHIDGVPVKAIPEQHAAGEVEGVGVTVENLRLLLRCEDLPTPKIGQELSLDGAVWIVSDTSVLAGVLDLQLFRDVS